MRPATGAPLPFPPGPQRDVGDIRLGALKLPGNLRASLLAFLTAEARFKARRQSFPVAVAFELAQDIARDISVLADSLAGHPRSPEMLAVLEALLAALDALTTSYAAPRKHPPSRTKENLI